MKNFALIGLFVLAATAAKAEIEINDGESQFVSVKLVSLKVTPDNQEKIICVEKNVFNQCKREETLVQKKDIYVAKDEKGKMRMRFVLGKNFKNEVIRTYSYYTSRGEQFDHEKDTKSGVSAKGADALIRVLKTASVECPVTIVVDRADGAIKKINTSCDSMN